ncbi:MAG: acyltransferase family protein [Pacificimonas sp.]
MTGNVPHAGRENYRRDIDGLRAVAVVAVILYHIDHKLLPGGYLGVDVFFVISGYLITGIIHREMREERFSLLHFYERRIRRILPALLLLLSVTTLASVLILLPGDLMNYGGSLLATLGFVANVYFFRKTDYFFGDADEKPLLHMWSLGIEEQFYLLFPLILILLFRFPRMIFSAVFALAGLSFAIDVAAQFFNKTNPAFFLLPFRAWELGFGALLAIHIQKRTAPQAQAPRPASYLFIAAVGFALVVTGLSGYRPLSSFSIPAPLLAVTGTALMIWAHQGGNTIISRLLSARPVVAIGLISYSLYLWHWPLLVLPRYYLVRPFSLWEALGLMAVALACAALSWRYLERPFRDATLPTRRALAILGAWIAAIAISGASLIVMDGLPQRLNPRATAINAAVGSNYRCAVTEYMSFGALHACPLNLPGKNPNTTNVVLFGNSHAQMYAPAVENVLRADGRTGLLVPMGHCLPTTGVNLNAECARTVRENLDAIVALPAADMVIVAAAWELSLPLVGTDGRRLEGDPARLVLQGLGETVRRLQAAGKTVVLVGPIAIPRMDVASKLSRELAFDREETVRIQQPHAVFLRTYGRLIHGMSALPDVTLLRPDLIQCASGQCLFIDGNESLFADSNHLAEAALPRFQPMFDNGL